MSTQRAGGPRTALVSCRGLTFEGASDSAHTTFVLCRELDVVFDIGSVTEAMLPANFVLVTHGHQDHLLGLTRYVGLRRLQGMRPPTVLMPAVIVDGVRELFSVWQGIEGYGARRPPEVNLVGVEPGQEFPLRDRLFARVLAVDHSVPSVGYTVIERTQKLKSEFHGTPGHELAALKMGGTEITSPVDKHLVTYLGDTLPSTLDKLGDLSASQVVMVECTFLLPDHQSLAAPRGHLHVQDLIERLDMFGDAEIVLMHFSRRYGPSVIEDAVRDAWPEDQMHRLHLLI
jgi:ribonuclease Z